MSVIKKQPGDAVDLEFTLGYDGTSANESRGVRAVVYDPNGAAITGSPFAMTHEADGRYVNDGAFTADIIGRYRILYKIYTDGTYATEDLNFMRGTESIDCQYEALGAGVEGSDLDALLKAIKALFEDLPRRVWRFDPTGIKNEKTVFVRIIKWLKRSKAPEIDISPLKKLITSRETQVDFSGIIKKIESESEKLQSSNNELSSVLDGLVTTIEKLAEQTDDSRVRKDVERLRKMLNNFNNFNSKRFDTLKSAVLTAIKSVRIPQVKVDLHAPKDDKFKP